MHQLEEDREHLMEQIERARHEMERLHKEQQKLEAVREDLERTVSELKAVELVALAGDQPVPMLTGAVTPEPGLRPPIVIATTGGAKRAAQVAEDMAVMSHVLHGMLAAELGKEHLAEARPGSFAHVLGGPGTRDIYLEGYGAVLFASVGFPLVAPPGPKPEEPQPEGGSLWEEARREVYGPPVPAAPHLPPDAAFHALLGPQYEAGRVEVLRDVLLRALREAANMHLDADEWVTVVVIGGDRPGRRFYGQQVSIVAKGTGTRQKVIRHLPGVRPESLLVARARKSAIDRHAARVTTLEEFRDEVEVVSY